MSQRVPAGIAAQSSGALWARRGSRSKLSTTSGAWASRRRRGNCSTWEGRGAFATACWSSGDNPIRR
eukprot:8901846-Alexandrium_andersonii.AAC.1